MTPESDQGQPQNEMPVMPEGEPVNLDAVEYATYQVQEFNNKNSVGGVMARMLGMLFEDESDQDPTTNQNPDPLTVVPEGIHEAGKLLE